MFVLAGPMGEDAYSVYPDLSRISWTAAALPALTLVIISGTFLPIVSVLAHDRNMSFGRHTYLRFVLLTDSGHAQTYEY